MKSRGEIYDDFKSELNKFKDKEKLVEELKTSGVEETKQAIQDVLSKLEERLSVYDDSINSLVKRERYLTEKVVELETKEKERKRMNMFFLSLITIILATADFFIKFILK